MTDHTELLARRKFVSDWLFNSTDRVTSGMPWSQEHKEDCARMIAAATRDLTAQLEAERAAREEAERKLHAWAVEANIAGIMDGADGPKRVIGGLVERAEAAEAKLAAVEAALKESNEVMRRIPVDVRGSEDVRRQIQENWTVLNRTAATQEGNTNQVLSPAPAPAAVQQLKGGDCHEQPRTSSATRKYQAVDAVTGAAHPNHADAAAPDPTLPGLELAAKICEKRAEVRFQEFGTTEWDTHATYYEGKAGEIYEAMDEEDDDCAAAIRAEITRRK